MENKIDEDRVKTRPATTHLFQWLLLVPIIATAAQGIPQAIDNNLLSRTVSGNDLVDESYHFGQSHDYMTKKVFNKTYEDINSGVNWKAAMHEMVCVGCRSNASAKAGSFSSGGH